MMNSVILCEGSTDYVLLQYYMRAAYGWEDDVEKQSNIFKVQRNKSRKFYLDKRTLTIASVGGCSKLCQGLEQALRRNYLAARDEFFQQFVLITDRDEDETEQNFIEAVTRLFLEKEIKWEGSLEHNHWKEFCMVNAVGEERKFRFLLLVIPFEQNGAMETFLLQSIADQDTYEKQLIEKCSDFVDAVDEEKRYLKSRRHITKAKFDAYFSIRTPVEQFTERQNILKSVAWETYTKLQKDFKLLSEL